MIFEHLQYLKTLIIILNGENTQHECLHHSNIICHDCSKRELQVIILQRKYNNLYKKYLSFLRSK